MEKNTSIKKPTQQQIEGMSQEIMTSMPVLRQKIEAACQDFSINADLALQEVLKFLYLIATYQRSLSPSIVVDMAWHEFILCTRLYMQFCDDQFGKYIHHTPGGDEKENKSKFLKTIQLYIVSFGEPDKAAWGDLAHDEWLDAQCGTCKSN